MKLAFLFAVLMAAVCTAAAQNAVQTPAAPPLTACQLYGYPESNPSSTLDVIKISEDPSTQTESSRASQFSVALYPPQAISKGLEGVVSIRFVISEDGSIQDVRILSSPRIFREVVADVIMKGKYLPRRVNGQAIRVDVQDRVEFSLRHGNPKIFDWQDPSPELPLKIVQPEYSNLAKLARIEGSVVVDLVYGEDRAYYLTSLRVSCGHPLLVPAVLNAMKEWRFKPRMIHGKPTPVAKRYILSFRSPHTVNVPILGSAITGSVRAVP